MPEPKQTRYRAYPEYKKSGLEWLGDFPSQWETRKAKHIFRRMQRAPREIDGIVTAFRDGEVTLRSNRRTDGFTNAVKEIGYQGVRKGDLLVHAMDGFAGAIGVSDSDGKCSPVCSVCTPIDNHNIDMPYYGYLVRQLAVTDYITSLAKGIRERSTEFRYNEFANLPLALPPLPEQTQIAAFLDYETAKIDALIAKQQRLIALLEEKRQAVISHAVTKGLNPDAPMRPSGIDWLGDVPAHWEVAKVKHAYHNLDSIRIPLSTLERAEMQGEFPYYGASGIIDYVDDFLFDESLVLVSEDGANLLARSTPIAFTATGRYWVNNHAHILKPMDENTEFWAEAIESNNLTPFVTGSAQPKFTSEALSNLPVVYPKDNSERDLLNKFIVDQKRQFGRSLTKTQTAITLLKERRTALISAAVTGKIDVRGWTPPDRKDTAA